MYIYSNPNPCGRRVGDCTIRAISALTGDSWKDVYLDLCREGLLRCDMPSSNDVWGAYLRNRGYERFAAPRCPDCYTVADFAEDHPYGKYLLALHEHVVTVIDGDYYDIWNSGDETVNFYWTKKGE